MMKVVIVYWSRYGNGKRLVEYVSSRLEGMGNEVQVLRTEETDPRAMPDADRYVFSSPTEAFRVQANMRQLMKKLEGMEGKRYGIINTHGMDRNWLSWMEKTLGKKRMVKASAVDFKVGKNAESGNALPEGWEGMLDEFVNRLV